MFIMVENYSTNSPRSIYNAYNTHLYNIYTYILKFFLMVKMSVSYILWVLKKCIQVITSFVFLPQYRGFIHNIYNSAERLKRHEADTITISSPYLRLVSIAFHTLTCRTSWNNSRQQGFTLRLHVYCFYKHTLIALSKMVWWSWLNLKKSVWVSLKSVLSNFVETTRNVCVCSI